MNKLVLIGLLCVWCLTVALQALPPGERVLSQRAVIEKIWLPEEADKEFPFIRGGSAKLLVRCIGESGARRVEGALVERDAYWVAFTAPEKLMGTTRSQGKKPITFADLRVGQEIVFSGSGSAGFIYTDQYRIYLDPPKKSAAPRK